MHFGSDVVARGCPAGLKKRFRFIAGRAEHLGLAVLVVVVTLTSAAWNVQDTRPMPIQDAHIYLTKALQFSDTIQAGAVTGSWRSVSRLGFQGRPPLYQLLTVPFIWLFGRSMDAALSVNLVFQAVLIVSTYGIGSLVKNRRAGLLAALLVAAYPPVLNLSRMYLPHYAAVACVALSLWLLLLLIQTRSVRIGWLFGASLGLGALVSHYFVLHLSVPTVLSGLYMTLFQTNPRWPHSLGAAPSWLLAKLRDTFVLRGLVPAALIAVALMAPWYLTNGLELFSILERIMEWEDVAVGFREVEPSFWWYALTMPGAISRVFAVFLVGGLVAGIIERRVYTSVLVIAVLAAYCSLSLETTWAWYRFAPALPAAAALTASWVVDVADWGFPSRAGKWRAARVAKVDRDKGQITVTQVGAAALTLRLPTDHRLWDSIEEGRSLQITPKAERGGKTRYILRRAPERSTASLVSMGLVLVCAGVAAFNFSMVTWGVQPWSLPIAKALGAPVDSETCLKRFAVAFCPNPARDEDWHVGDIVQIVLDDPACDDRRCHLEVVSVEVEFRSAVFKQYLAQEFPGAHVEVRGPGGGPHGSRPFAFNDVLRADHVLYTSLQEGQRCREGLPLICTMHFLREPPAVFADTHREVASVALPTGRSATLVKRTKPLTYEEARASIEAFNVPEEEKARLLSEIDELFGPAR